MKLVTFQSMEALKDLVNKGYLECDESKINIEKVGATYSWVLEKMNDRIKNPTHIKYPLWCWVRCYNNICHFYLKFDDFSDVCYMNKRGRFDTKLKSLEVRAFIDYKDVIKDSIIYSF